MINTSTRLYSTEEDDMTYLLTLKKLLRRLNADSL